MVRLLDARFIACIRRDRLAEITAIAAEELAVARQLDDRDAEVRALTHMGLAATQLGRFGHAETALGRAVAAARDPTVADLPRCEGFATLAFVYLTIGRPERALPLLEEALGIDRRSKSAPISLHLYYYGMALTDLGRPADAEAPLEEALRETRRQGNDMRTAYLEQALADGYIRQGRMPEAAERLDRARQLHEKIGAGDGLAESLRSTADPAAAEGRWADALGWLRRALEIWRRIDSHIEIARTLARLERVHSALGDRETAQECRHEVRHILVRLRLDDACLYVPPCYRDDR